MALCSCFKTQHNDEGARRKSNNRASIRSEKNELDLLEIQKRGMEPNNEDDQYYVRTEDNDDHRVSHQTDMKNSFNGEARVSIFFHFSNHRQWHYNQCHTISWALRSV